MKRCKVCGTEKPLDGFYRSGGMTKDGRAGKCIQCAIQAAVERRKAKYKDPKYREQYRARARERYWRAAALKPARAFVSPEAPDDVKQRARSAVAIGIADGTIQRPETCAQCGGPGKRIEAHHPDYHRPLHVEWLCTKCHKARHFKPVDRKKLRPVNQKRRKRLHAEQFGPPEFGEFVRNYGCVIAIEGGSSEDCDGPIQVAHRKSRGAGGGWRDNCYGLCAAHHVEQHAVGLVTFENEYCLDGDLWACAITHKFDLAHPEAAA